MTPDLARRRALLTAALGFALLDTKGKPVPAEVQTVRRWLDNWQGLGQRRHGDAAAPTLRSVLAGTIPLASTLVVAV